MKQLALILALTLSATSLGVAQNAVNLDDNGEQVLPAYDLSIGIERHFADCNSFNIGCVGGAYPVGFERVDDHIVIEEIAYALVTWFRTVGYNSITETHYFQTDTLYYRTFNDTLYQWTPQGDSLIFDFSFKGGMDYQAFFNAFLPVSLNDYMVHNGNIGIPVQFDYDTTATFPNGLNYRIVYGHSDYDDDYANLTLPTQKEFVENHLSASVYGENLLLPLEEQHVFVFYRPFYFVHGMGVFLLELNHNHRAMTGIKLPDGSEIGQLQMKPTSIDRGQQIQEVQLSQNYPNPFNPTTQITYSLENYEYVEMAVFNMLGQKVQTLVNSQMQPGQHEVTFNAQDLASGIYIYQLRTENRTLSKIMTLVK